MSKTPSDSEHRKKRITAPSGKTYFIPVDGEEVPRQALLARLLAGSKPNDLHSTEKVIKRPFTPERIAEWWDSPNTYDLQGIDTKRSKAFGQRRSVKKSARNAHERIAIAGSRKDIKKARRIIDESFTLKEQKLMAKSGLVISISDLPSDIEAQYQGKNANAAHVVICDPKHLNEETLTHELVHYSRFIDPERRGVTKSRSLSKDRLMVPYERLAEEEAATTAETMARCRCPPDGSYYTFLSGNAERLAAEDKQKLKGGLKGKRAQKAVEKNWHELHISQLDLGYGPIKRKR